MTTGTPLLDALEGFYAAPVEDIAMQLSSRLAAAHAHESDLEATLGALQAADFLVTYLGQIQQVPVSDWLEGLDEGPGTVRASIVGRELSSDTDIQRRSMIIDGEHLRGDGLPLRGLPPGQLSAALCYAHDVTVEDPFDEEQILGDFITDIADSMPHVPIRIAPDPAHFVSTVSALARIAPLVRAGHIVFVPRRLAMDARMAGKFGSNAWEAFDAQREELALRSLRLWLGSGGLITPLFGNAEEQAAFEELAGVLMPLTRTNDSLRLQRVARLALPAAGRLDPNQMVRIREDDAFETFRVAQRRALAVIEDGSDTELADYRAEMAQAAREVGKSVSTRTSLNNLFTRALGWSVGALILAPNTWAAAVAALGGITTQVAAERIMSRENASKRALRHHFATLGKTPADIGRA